jgi:hypothetical protein
VDWRTLFKMQHLQVHTDRIEPGGGGFNYQDLLLAGLSQEELRLIPADRQNSIVWLLWHMTRCEDVAINVILGGREQVLETGWAAKLNIDRADIGTGMTPDEVLDLSQRIDIDALLAYRYEVALRTRDQIDRLDDEMLEQPLFSNDPRLTDAARTLGDHAGWVADFWRAKPMRWFLWLPTGHCYQHIGEGLTIRSLSGHPGTR